RYTRNPASHTVPYAGVIELLDNLVYRGIRLSVLSNKEDGLTREVVSRTIGTKYFDVIRGRSPDFPAKPDPAGARFIMEQMGVNPEEVIYVGDSDVDMETAVRGGMYPVGVLWGYRSREEILNAGAEVLVDEPKNILTLLSEG
ncbi:MAG: HAD family hydrolase, partial [Spirochaetia bacterium]